MNKPQYKLKLTAVYARTKNSEKTITRSFVWDNKEDALKCKELLEKAKLIGSGYVEFLEFYENELK